MLIEHTEPYVERSPAPAPSPRLIERAEIALSGLEYIVRAQRWRRAGWLAAMLVFSIGSLLPNPLAPQHPAAFKNASPAATLSELTR